ncbi:MAG: aminoglycoside phosphotransferase family protein [Rhizomicrobium sp.]
MPTDRTAEMDAFLKQAGWAAAVRTPMPGDASTRRYVRLDLNGRKAMLMDQPQTAEAPAAPATATPDERRALGYNAVARLAGADVARFVAASNYLRAQGLSAPEIYAADPARGFAIIEDLGDALYADVVNDHDEKELYAAAADVLATLHGRNAPELLPPDKALHAYDETALTAEIDLLTEWFMPVALGRAATADELAEHRALWQAALHETLKPPSVFVHRDYHAQNLIWLPSRSGLARVGLIDFQDAVAGSKAYDLISLVEDARRDVAPDVAEATTAHYLQAMKRQGTPLDERAYRSQMAVMAAQRNAKIAGIFARLYKRDSKPRYLGYLPRVWGYLNRDLEDPALRKLKAWYDRAIPRARRGTPDGVTL